MSIYESIFFFKRNYLPTQLVGLITPRLGRPLKMIFVSEVLHTDIKVVLTGNAPLSLC
jgi:hypothetical protein